MKSRTTKTPVGSCIALCALFIFPIFLAACGSSSSSSDETSSDKVSVSFSVVWQDTANQSSVLKVAKLADDCTTLGVSWVKAQVLDENDKIIAEGPRKGWPCNVGEGSITGVPIGDNRKIVVFGVDSNWDVLYRGEKSGISVTAGQTNHAGTIEAYAFVSMLSSPTHGSTVTNGDFSFEWKPVTRASKYRLMVSEDSGFDFTIIDDTTTNTMYTPSGLSHGMTYYWRVYAYDSNGNYGAGSKIWSFMYNPGSMFIHWIEKTSMPVPVTAFGYAVVDSNIYIIGGDISGSSTAVQRYTPATDTWEADTNNGGTLAPLPEPRAVLYCGVMNRKIHAIGGWEDGTYRDDHFIYDPDSNTWSTGPSLPQYPIGQFSATVNNKIYVFGGWWGSYHGYVFEYSEGGGWSSKSPMPTARAHGTTAVYQGKIYVIGGEDGQPAQQQLLDVVEMYDPETDTWTTGLAPMPSPQHWLGRSGSPVSNGMTYVLGPAKTAYAYDPQSDSWGTVNSMPNSAYGIAAINGSIYAIGPEHTFQGLQPATKNLVAYWNFDSCDASDYSDNSNDGSIQGNPGCVDGIRGKAFVFDGVDDYVEVLDSNKLDITNQITVSHWFKMTDVQQFTFMLSKGSSPGTFVWATRIDTSKSLYFDIRTTYHGTKAAYFYGTDDLNDDTWHHIGGTFDGSSVKIYLDGVLRAANDIGATDTLATNDEMLTIACMGNYRYNGAVDEIKIYDRALPEEEITELYAQGKP